MDRLIGWLAAPLCAAPTLIALLAWQSPAVAKPTAQTASASEGQEKDEDFADNVFPTAERGLLVQLSKARQLIARERYSEAIQCLGTILDAPEDAFLRPGSRTDAHGLKAEAESMLGRLPRQGRELYELACGAEARKMLSAAVAAGDAEGLAEVSRRFFHTQAGYEATLLLGLHQWNHGSPLAAALTLKRLKESCPVADQFEPGLSAALAASWYRAGSPEKAQLVLDDLRRRFPKAAVRLGGKEVSLAGGELARVYSDGVAPAGPKEADDWLMFGGNPARNAAVTASAPLLSVHWRIPTVEHPYLESRIEEIQQGNRDQDRWTLPSSQPLVVHNVVLMRTARNLLAVDFITGKRIWEVPGDDPFESLSEAAIGLGPTAEDPFGGMRGGGFDLNTALRYRLWGDATFGILSSDGERVFAIEDLSLDLGTSMGRAMFMMPNRRMAATDPKSYNRLAAYDVRTGKLVWHVGGAPEEAGLALAGTFFLGAPLPVGGKLYAIAEQKGDIRLLVFEAKTGKLAWSQQLGAVEQDRDILQDPLRRVSGVSPSYADGILVCPTSSKSVVAVEPATRSLLWGYAYKPSDAAQTRQAPMFFGPAMPRSDPEPANRWARTEAVLAEGRALITPVDSPELHCLNVIDGKPLWRKPREDDTHLAGVYQGKVILLGRRGLRALKLADGEPAWQPARTELPVGAMPSGTGFLSGGRYYLPLSTGEVAAVDLNSGRIAHLYRSRRGAVPGNLVCEGGRVLSQRGGAVEEFFQIDALRREVDRRLAAKPNDAEALAQRGEILWDEGNLHDAIDCFRRSLASAPSPNARSLLRDALLDGLRTDFAHYRQSGDEIRALIDEPRQEATFLRVMATGLEQAKQFAPAFENYLKLVELDQKQRELEPVETAHSVRRDRWIQVHLAEMRNRAPADVRAKIDQAVQARLDTALKAGTIEALQRFLDYFGAQPAADQARLRLVGKLRDARRLLAAEMLLRRIERSDDRRTAGAAVAEMAFLLRDAGLADDSALCFRRLRDEFGDVVCRDGKTGRQLTAALGKDDPVRRCLGPDPAWPTGAIIVKSERQTRAPITAYYPSAVMYQQPAGPYFSDLTLELHQNPRELVARDGWGKDRWRLPLSELMGPEGFPMNSALLKATVDGHLLLLSMGFKIVAIDALAAGEGRSPRVLWVQDLEEPVKTVARRARNRMIMMQAAMRGVHTFGGAQFPVNLPGAASEQLVCYQRYQNLYGVDPVSGEVLWVREDIRPGSTVFGDQQYVLVVPPDQNEAMVLRAADGKKIGTRPVPPGRQATQGRLVASWRTEDAQSMLEMIDPIIGRPAWPPRKFSADAKIFTFEYDKEVIGVLEPQGHFTLVRLADGRALVDAGIEHGRTIVDVHVVRSPEQTLVIVTGMERGVRDRRQHFGLQGVSAVPVSRAKIYAYDPKGKSLWPHPATVQDQFLVLSQPRRLPALVFACGVQNPRAMTPTQPRTAILAVDKRTGRVVETKDSYDGLSHFRLEGHPEKKTIEIGLQRDVVVLRFADHPETIAPSAALLKALERGARKALKLPLDDDKEDADGDR